MVLEELMGLTDEEFMDSLLLISVSSMPSILPVLKSSLSVTVHLAVSAEGVLLTKQRLALT